MEIQKHKCHKLSTPALTKIVYSLCTLLAQTPTSVHRATGIYLYPLQPRRMQQSTFSAILLSPQGNHIMIYPWALWLHTLPRQQVPYKRTRVHPAPPLSNNRQLFTAAVQVATITPLDKTLHLRSCLGSPFYDGSRPTTHLYLCLTPAHQILESPLVNRQESTTASWPPYKLLTLSAHRHYV